MKTLNILLALLAINGTSIMANDIFPTSPETINVSFGKSYVPVGFDDNDRTQITIEGSFPNTCYKVGPYATKVDLKTQTINVQQQAYRYNGICLQMIVPFNQVIDLGILPKGEYKIVDATTGKALSSIRIDQATKSEADEFLYAPMTDAYISTDPATGIHTLAVLGAFSDRCTVFEDIKVNYTSDVIVVQPIVKHIADRRNCGQQKVRFVKTVQLKDGLTGLYLLHVRSMNGQAINKMVDLP
jgi:hypothetical protein